MPGFSVRPDQLVGVAIAVNELADDAAANLRRLEALAEDVFGAGWCGVAASAYAQEWQAWRSGAQAALAALGEMSAGLRRAAAGYAGEEAASTVGFERIAS